MQLTNYVFFSILRVNTNYFTFFQTNKPLTEKRRRERINNSLMQLKTLVLRGTNKEVTNSSKLKFGTRYLM